MNAQITTITGCPEGLRSGFDRAKEVAKESEVGMAYLDPSGVGEPTFVVCEGDTWEDWSQDPGRVMDNSNVLTLQHSTLAEALAEYTFNGRLADA